MFASILRRWRLVTPLALISVASLVVLGANMLPAGAHHAPKFDGRASGALVTLDTPFSITHATMSACDTGKVSTRNSTQVGPVTGGEPIVLTAVIAQSPNDSQFKVVVFSKCGSEVKINSHTKRVTSTAEDFGFADIGGITVHDASNPPFETETINLPAVAGPDNFADLSSTSTAHCVKGVAHFTSDSDADSATATAGNVIIVSNNNGGNNPVTNDTELEANQVLSGLSNVNFTAILDEVDTTSTSVTTIGLHVFGNGVDVRLAQTTASAHC